MDDKTRDGKKYIQNDSMEDKDRRRFLKQLTTCAILSPAITILLPRFAAAGSGFNTGGGNHGNGNYGNGNHGSGNHGGGNYGNGNHGSGNHGGGNHGGGNNR